MKIKVKRVMCPEQFKSLWICDLVIPVEFKFDAEALDMQDEVKFIELLEKMTAKYGTYEDDK